MEIGQNIKEFTEDGEVVLIYTLSLGARVLQVTNAAAAVVSYSVGGREILGNSVQFLNNRIDSRTRIWSAEVEDEAVIFTAVEGEVPSRVTFSLTDDGFEVAKIDAPTSQIDLAPFEFNLAENATLSVAGYYDQTPVNELGRSVELEVKGWSESLVFNVAEVEDSGTKIALRSSMPLLKITKRVPNLSLEPLDEVSRYCSDSQDVPEGAIQAIDHSVICSVELK